MPRNTDTTRAREVLLSKTSKYEEPYQYWLLNKDKGESLRTICRKFKADPGGFTRYIKNQESTQESTQISAAIRGIKGGLEIIKTMQESTNKRDNQLSQKAIATLEEYYPSMKSVFASIQNRVLNALDLETQKMEAMGELDLNNIAKAQAVLKLANDTNAFIPKTPLVAVQNNVNASPQSQSPQSEIKAGNKLEFKVSFKKPKTIEAEVIDVKGD